jgi:hypothetical protein
MGQTKCARIQDETVAADGVTKIYTDRENVVQVHHRGTPLAFTTVMRY